VPSRGAGRLCYKGVIPAPAASDRAMTTLHSSVASPERLSAQAQASLAIRLALIAGYVDAYGFISYSTYLSFMSGNTTQTGFTIGQGKFFAAFPTLLAIVFFVGGVFIGTLLGRSARRHLQRPMLGLVAVFLTLSIVIARFADARGGLDITILSFAMGMMNTTLSRVGSESLNLTFVTGTLGKIAGHLAFAISRMPLEDAQGAWDTHLHRAFLLAGVWTGFLAGAVLSGAATPYFGEWALVLPLLVLAYLVVFGPRSGARTY
jgi:uncharacterized membrane protein YoaK (UPF0700 family)